MVKKLLPWVRVAVIVTSLLLGQVQMMVTSAAPTTGEEEVDPAAAVAISDSQPVEAAIDDAALDSTRSLQLENECMLGVTGYAVQTIPTTPDLTAPFWGGTRDPAYFDNISYLRTAATARAVGDSVKFFVGVGNSTAIAAGCSAEILNNVTATITVDGTTSGGPVFTFPAAFIWPDPGNPGVLAPNEEAFFVFDYILPPGLLGDGHIRVTANADGITSGNHSLDFDNTFVRIEGPGAKQILFAPIAGDETASPGAAVTFELVIENTRSAGITAITVASSNGQFVTQCNGISNWTQTDGNPLAVPLVKGAQAKCTISNVVIPNNPAPETFTLSGTVTVSDGSNTMDMNLTSDPVNVSLPDMAVTKKVLRIDRGVDVIYTFGSGSVPPVVPGDLITYQVEIKNTGEVDLVDLFIVDSLTGPYAVGGSTTITPGSTFTISDITHLVIPGGQDPLTNTVHVTARGAGTADQVTAQAATSVDVVDSVLKVYLTAEDPTTGDELTVVERGQTVRYRLRMQNEGGSTLNEIAYVPLSYPLQTVGTEPPITNTSLAAGAWSTPLTWDYTIAVDDPDPLLSTVKIRARNSDNVLVYGQSQWELNISNPDIEISNIVLEPETPTVLRGGEVVYEVTVTNKDDAAPICNVVVNQYRRDPDTGIEVLVRAGLPLVWPDPAQPGQLGPSESAVGQSIYLVTGETKDPLEMIFEVTALDGCPGVNELTDRTTRVLDLSDAQINAQILPNYGPDGLATVGEELTLNFVAQNVGTVTLENLSATYCIRPHEFDSTPLCDIPFAIAPTTIASFGDAAGSFTYQIQPGDEDINPFIIEVTLFGTDNKGNTVSVKTALDLPIATDLLEVKLSGPDQAVVGDLEIFGYQIWNRTEVTLNNVRIYNLLEPEGSNLIAEFDSLIGQQGQVFSLADIFNQRIFQTGEVTIQDREVPIMTMRIRVEATRSDNGAGIVANAKLDLEIIPMVKIDKTPIDGLNLAGQPLTFRIRITNQSRDQDLTLTSIEDPVFDAPQYLIPYAISDFTATGVLPPQGWAEHEYTIPAVDPLPNPLVNTFTAVGTRSYDGAQVMGFGVASVDLECPVAILFNVKNLDAPNADYVMGERLQWNISLLNISGKQITNITVNESLNWGTTVPNGSITWPVGNVAGTLDPNEFAYLPTFDKLITSDYYVLGNSDVMRDNVTVTYDDGSGNQRSCNEYLEIPLWSPVWAIKEADPFVAFTGETVTYSFSLRNVTEDDDDPYDVYFIRSVTDSLLTPSGIRCDFNGDGTIGADEVSGFILPDSTILCETRQRMILPDDPEELWNTMRVEFPDPGSPDISFFTETEVMVETSNPLELTKQASVQEAVAGDSIFYDYVITNTSPYLVKDIEFVDNWVGNLIPQFNAGALLTLQPGATFPLSNIPFKIPVDAPDPLVNIATATGTVVYQGEERVISNTITETVDLVDSDLVVVKVPYLDNGSGSPGTALPDDLPTTGPDGMPEAVSGALVHWCFTVTNENPGTSTFVEEITVQDVMFPNALQQLFEDAVSAKYAAPHPTNLLYGTEFVEFCYGPQPLSTALGDPVTNVVAVQGVASSGVEIYNEYELNIDLLGQDLRVSKIPSQNLAYVGDEITYTIVLEDVNNTFDITNIEVSDFFTGASPSPLPMDLFDWSLSGVSGTPVGELAVGGRATYTYTYTIQPNDPVTLANTAVATGTLTDTNMTVVEDSTRASVAVTASQLLVQKTATTEIAEPEDVVTYNVSITNIGQTPVRNVMAVDRHYGNEDVYQGSDLSDVDLDPYETAFLTFTIQMPTAAELLTTPGKDPYFNEIAVYGVVFDNDGNPIVNTNPDGDPYLDGTLGNFSIKATDTESVDILNPNMRVTKDPSVLAQAPGGTVDYTITIRNVGQDVLTNLIVTDLMAVPLNPLNLNSLCPQVGCPFVYGPSFVDEDGDPNTPPVQNPRAGEPFDPAYSNASYPGLVGGLVSEETLIGTITVTIPADYMDTQFTNVVEVSGQAGVTGVTDRASATIDVREAGLNVTKTASTSVVPLGAPVDYTVTVTNIGGITFERLILTDKGIDPFNADGNGDPNTLVVTSGFPDSDEAVIPGDDSSTFDADEVFQVTYTYTITGVDGDPYVNRVTVRGVNDTTGSQAVNSAQATVDVQGVNVAVEKFVCADSPAPAPPPGACTTTVNISDGNPDTLTYYLHIMNTGSVALQNVTVTDSLVPATTFDTITWPLPNNGLAANDNAVDGDDEVWFTYTYDVQPSDLDPLTNVVSVTGETSDTPPVQVQAADTASVSLVAGDLQLTKTANMTSASIGETVDYTFTVENLSASDTIANIEIFDPMITQSAAPLCTVTLPLGPGESSSCGPISRTVLMSDPRPLVNTATATGIQAGTFEVTDTATHTLNIVTPGILVSKVANTNVASVGDVVTYVYAIENTSSNTIQSLTVLDSDTGVMADPNWVWPSFLPAGVTETVTIQRTLTATDPDPYVNTMTVTGTLNGQPIMAEATETVFIANGAVVAENTASTTYATPGQNVTFTYTIRNLGTEALTITGLTDGLCTASDANALMNQLASTNLAAGASVTVFCTQPAALPGPLASLLRVDATGAIAGAISDTAYAEVQVTSGEILVVKTADRATALVGDTITYTINVTNVGTEALENIVFTDATISNPLPAPPATLAIGASFTITGTYVVQAGDQSVSNTATVTADGVTSGNSFEDSDTVAVAVITDPNASLLLTKTTNTVSSQPGPSFPVDYTLRVQNVSNPPVTVNSIELYDGTTLVTTIPSLGPGNVFVTTYTSNVPANHVAPEYTNTATVRVGGNIIDTATETIGVDLFNMTKVANPTSVAPGGTVTYTYTVSKTTIQAISGVTLADSMEGDPTLNFTWVTPLPSDFEFLSGDKTAVATVTVPLNYSGATLDNTATLSVGGVAVEQAMASVTIAAPNPAIGVTVTAAPNPSTVGNSVTHTVTVTNTGNVDVTGLAGNYTITPNGGSASAPIALTLGATTLAPGASTTATVTRTEDQTGQYTFTAALTFAEQGVGDPPVEGSLTMTPNQPSGQLVAEILTITQDTPAGAPVVDGMVGQPLQTGEQVKVTARLSNTGAGTLLVDPPALAINITGPPAPACILAVTNTSNGSTTQWPGSIPAGASTDTMGLTLTFTCTLPARLIEYRQASEPINRTFTLSANSNSGNAVDTQQVTLIDLVVDVLLEAINPTTNVTVTSVQPNDQVKFRITLRNLGASRLGCSNLEVTPVAPGSPKPPCRLGLTGSVQAGGLADATLTTAFNTALGGAMTSASATVGTTVLTPATTGNDTAIFTSDTFTVTGTQALNFGLQVDGGYFNTTIFNQNPGLLAEYTTFDVTSLPLTVAGTTPTLNLNITVQPSPPVYGQGVVYGFVVSNPSTGIPVTGLKGTYALTPSGASVPQDGIVLASANRQTTVTGDLTFLVTDLVPGQSASASPIARIEGFSSSYVVSMAIQVDGMAATEYLTYAVNVTPILPSQLTPTPTGTGTSGAATGDPSVAKSTDADTVQPGGVVNWTIVVTNETDSTFDAVTLQDALPTTLTISAASTSSGTVNVEGQLITLDISGLAPGATATLSLSTTVNADAEAPAEITNTACALRVGGNQICDAAAVSLAPGVEGLPLTGQRFIATGDGMSDLGWLALVLLGAMALMMAAQTSDRRMLLAGAALLVVLVIIVVVVMLSLLGDDDTATPTEEAGVPPADTTGPDSPAPNGGPGDAGQASVIQFPPTPTPYVLPTPAGLRYLVIPKLGEQFSVPVPIVELPIVNREWDVSGLGQYVGWLEGTTWLDRQWGNTVLAAHVQLGTNNPGPFWGLGELQPGDEIKVIEGESERTYIVTSTEKVNPNDWSVTAPTDDPVLTLITCTEWDQAGGIFSQRMVVRAVPSES